MKITRPSALVTLVVLAAACGDLSVRECAVRCGDDQSCALGLTCGGDGFCHRDTDLNHCGGASDGGSTGGPYNFMFITSQTYAPGGSDFHSVADGDRICAELASASTVPGVAGNTYVAWLSDSNQSAIDRLKVPGTNTDARGWLRPDGRPFADALRASGTSAGLQGGQIYYPPRIDENGNDLVAFDSSDVPAPVATGTASGGMASTSNAQGWTSTSASYTAGTGAGTTRLWTAAFVLPNASLPSDKVHLYCFGVDRVTPLAITKESGRVAFLSRGMFAPSSGLATANQLCSDEAASATPPLEGTYSALLNGSTTSAASRFAEGTQWVRTDGVIWAQGLSVAQLMTSLNVDTQLNYRADPDVWTGIISTGPGVAGPSTCSDWTSASSGQKGGVGEAASSSSRLFFHDSPACGTQSHAVYCLQN